MKKKDLLLDIIKDDVKLSQFLAALPANMLAKYAGYNKGVAVKKTADADDVFVALFPEHKDVYLDTICVFKDPTYPGRTVVETSFHLERGGRMVDATKIFDNEELLMFPDLFQEI